MDEGKLWRVLGRIEGKQDSMCKSIDELKQQWGNLPCHMQYQACQEQINTKVSWKQFIGVITIVGIIVGIVVTMV